ncbi:hypothetical protein Q4543_05705 [Salipiger sp. 1_MG-2023]|uniref:hypothetical protein n=1 Tax=Salipiger sp. 1_MG-2023 TaxID=3062665 RepID=UPI0026E1740A|nr:hypothetical protein [Salipiger sp. 1_MG-2023]MDO6585006.1 hypothetical protein [Salipiger sp. 1_MG-2023]
MLEKLIALTPATILSVLFALAMLVWIAPFTPEGRITVIVVALLLGLVVFRTLIALLRRALPSRPGGEAGAQPAADT